MPDRPLTAEEEEFQGVVSEFFSFIGKLQVAAGVVKEAGGNCEYAFLSGFPEEDRPMVALQWPMLSMAFGL